MHVSWYSSTQVIFLKQTTLLREKKNRVSTTLRAAVKVPIFVTVIDYNTKSSGQSLCSSNFLSLAHVPQAKEDFSRAVDSNASSYVVE